MPVNPNPPTEEVGKAYTDMLMLYYEVSKWNQGCSYGSASNVLSATQQLLLHYNEQCLAYLEDETEGRSLIFHIAGSDGLEQWELYKALYTLYDVHIF